MHNIKFRNVLVRSLKSSILSSTIFQMGDSLLESGEYCCIFPEACVTVPRGYMSNLGVVPTGLLSYTGNSDQ